MNTSLLNAQDPPPDRRSTLKLVDLTAIHARLAEDDPMRSLPYVILVTLIDELGVTDTDRLLESSDRRILLVAEASRRADTASMNRLRRWLAVQRHARSARPSSPIETKVRADEMMQMALHAVADAVRAAVAAEGLQADVLARRCGTSREAVQSLLAGGVPTSLEAAFRLAAALGIRLELNAQPTPGPHAGADRNPSALVRSSKS